MDMKMEKWKKSVLSDQLVLVEYPLSFSVSTPNTFTIRAVIAWAKTREQFQKMPHDSYRQGVAARDKPTREHRVSL